MDPGENSRCTSHGPNEGRTSSADGNHQHYTKPDTWRSWSLNRAGFNNTEFEGTLFPILNFILRFRHMDF